jgi:hypothetical protein
MMGIAERRARMKEFDRSGMLGTKVFRQSLVFVGVLGVAALAVCIPGCISSARAGNWFLVTISSIGILLGIFLEGLAVSGIRARRHIAETKGGDSIPR